MFVLRFVWNNSRTARWVSILIFRILGKNYWASSIFFSHQTSLTTTSHEGPHTFLCRFRWRVAGQKLFYKSSSSEGYAFSPSSLTVYQTTEYKQDYECIFRPACSTTNCGFLTINSNWENNKGCQTWVQAALKQGSFHSSNVAIYYSSTLKFPLNLYLISV